MQFGEHTTTPAAAGATKKRHAFHAWPHRQHARAACRACCLDLAAEFAADELRLLDALTREREPEISASEALPF